MYCSFFVVIYLKLFLKLASSQCEITVIPLYAFHGQARFTLTKQRQRVVAASISLRRQVRRTEKSGQKLREGREKSAHLVVAASISLRRRSKQ
jgi:hypothetical protein